MKPKHLGYLAAAFLEIALLAGLASGLPFILFCIFQALLLIFGALIWAQFNEMEKL